MSEPMVRPEGPLNGVEFQGFASKAAMKKFSDANPAQNPNSAGKHGLCFNYYRRGACRLGSTCHFVHVPLYPLGQITVTPVE